MGNGSWLCRFVQVAELELTGSWKPGISTQHWDRGESVKESEGLVAFVGTARGKGSFEVILDSRCWLGGLGLIEYEAVAYIRGTYKSAASNV